MVGTHGPAGALKRQEPASPNLSQLRRSVKLLFRGLSWSAASRVLARLLHAQAGGIVEGPARDLSGDALTCDLYLVAAAVDERGIRRPVAVGDVAQP